MTIGVLDKDGNSQTISTIDDLIAIVGAAVASPAANTVGDRLKALATALATNHADEAVLHADIATTLAGLIGTSNTSLAALVTALGSTALDYGPGTGGSRTQRVAFDTAQFGTAGIQIVAQSTSVEQASDSSAWRMSQDSSVLLNGKTALTPKFAAIAASSSGDNSIVALVSAKKIRVLAYKLVANGAVNAKWRSNTTDKTGLSYMAAAGDGEVLPYNPLGWFETAVGEALQLNLSAALAVGGHLTYVEV
jgi:hypothetical protein